MTNAPVTAEDVVEDILGFRLSEEDGPELRRLAEKIRCCGLGPMSVGDRPAPAAGRATRVLLPEYGHERLLEFCFKLDFLSTALAEEKSSIRDCAFGIVYQLSDEETLRDFVALWGHLEDLDLCPRLRRRVRGMIGALSGRFGVSAPPGIEAEKDPQMRWFLYEQ